ncbi:hypothetical protein SODALDRAFT_182805 [Sodiomyces alkalinus F11]|uniref:Uncharacterized protein n=1 Tax=Sodiomyces alkalinus (strain CBS 110278 / VKM F-3762 / F11) TaxID=1314773 RepID=A0A3N2PUH2_SODAK|nr:hypothetical protein SODALDRAFT_182805 [Sodiomyces alkalinus F11]ROT38149.1 hypothetical protein SODALDRAFT_182805 [Sodiomyces alkalinus F11]
MLQLLPAQNLFNYFLLLLAALSATIFFSNAKDEPNFEDDDSMYAFYGGAKRYRGPRPGIKRVAFDI